jgi:hypothetical protein
MDTVGSGEVKTATATLDIAERDDIHKLRHRAVGLRSYLLLAEDWARR